MANYNKVWDKAQKLLPGGVNSPVRAFRSVKRPPLIVSRAKGSKIYDLNHHPYTDMVMSWGPLILGHAHPKVLKSIKEAISEGTSYGALTEKEIELAQEICKAIPSIQKIRFVSSGTEAAMTAIRLARAFTGRSKIIKFEGCYHGHSDFLLAKAGSGLATYSLPGSSGIPKEALQSTLVLPFNDLSALEKTFKCFPNQIAAVITEPVPANMGVVLPKKGFLEGMRKLCKANGALLIFDEVITGFRIMYGGVQDILKVKPDLTILGKIIGGGLPVGALGGSSKIMDLLAPLGPVYQAGTLSGNPVAMSAGLKTLELLKDSSLYEKLSELSTELALGLDDIIQERRIKAQVQWLGSMLTLFFTASPVENYRDALKSDTALFSRFYRKIFQQGIFLPPSQFEAWFLSTAHSKKDIQDVLAKARSAIN